MIEKIDAKLKQLKPVIGEKKAVRLRQAYLLEDDFREKKEIENRIDLLLSRHVNTSFENEIILPPPEQKSCSGDIPLGRVEYLEKPLFPFQVKLRDINRHAGIFGSTGSGKTTLAMQILRQLHEKKIPFLIIDWEKNYRCMAKEIPGLEVFTIGKKDIHPLFLNLLNVPPGMETGEYIKSLIALISEDYLSGAGSDSMFLQYMESTYDEHKNPTFTELKELILREIQKDMGRRGRLSGRSGLWKETVARIIRFLSSGSSGNVLNSNKHFPLEELFSRPIVLEFGNIKNPRDRKFLIHIILNQLAQYNEYHGILSEKLKQVIVFEEFHNICLRSREDNMVSNLFRESRKYGLGLIAIDQTPSEIPNAIFSNMNVKVSFALGTHQDISTMAKAMNLQPDQREYIGMLKTGQAIANVRQSMNEAFVFRVPFVQSDENISDEELKRAMRPFSKDSHVICSLNDDSRPSQAPQNSDILPPTIEPGRLSALERCVLTDICGHPFDGVDKRTKRLGMHPAQMKELHDLLIRKALIKPVMIDNLKLFEFTDHGRKQARKNGIMIPVQKTRGGVEHAYVVRRIMDHLIKIGLDPKAEVNDIDIVVDEPEQLIAVEVETGKSNIYGNLAKLTKSFFKNKYMIATRKEAEIQLNRITGTLPDIKVIHFRNFLKLSKEKIMPQ